VTQPTISFRKPRPFITLRDDLSGLMPTSLPPVDGRVLSAVRAVTAGARPTEYRVVLNWVEEPVCRERKPAASDAANVICGHPKPARSSSRCRHAHCESGGRGSA
jgi:hypothetical protein